jgi:hypothetical protein
MDNILFFRFFYLYFGINKKNKNFDKLHRWKIKNW